MTSGCQQAWVLWLCCAPEGDDNNLQYAQEVGAAEDVEIMHLLPAWKDRYWCFGSTKLAQQARQTMNMVNNDKQ